MPSFRLLPAFLAFALTAPLAPGADSLQAYAEGEVPDNVVDLWKDIDFRKDPLETEVVKEWSEDGVVCRYVIFKVGTFKGADSRIAAFYTFPEGAKAAPAFVWAHGGGQRADRKRGNYFAKRGYATLDINWGGREIAEGIRKNTDWGKVDPSQGPRFYPGALRKHWKTDLRPDEHSIDPVMSPRNSNWFLLAYAGRRAITFLEQQAEVDPEKIGFTGYSMGGNITSYAAIDPRVKAAIPMVGGSGYITADFPGLPGTGRKLGDAAQVKWFADTIESQSYYPHVKCPVLLLSATDDFHSTFEAIYRALNQLPHDKWRVSQKLHYNHNLGGEQWHLFDLWFDKYLKGEPVEIPKTPFSTFKVEGKSATFTATADPLGAVPAMVEIYYSHDPNPKSRFWIKAKAVRTGETWSADLPVREHLPLYAFANASYALGKSVDTLEGSTRAFTLTSDEAVHLPAEVKADLLHAEAKPQPVLADFAKNGYRDWGRTRGGGIQTWKFRDPRMATPPPTAKLRVTIDAPRGKLSYRFRIAKNRYIAGVKAPQADYWSNKEIKEPGKAEFLIAASDFNIRDKPPMSDWSNITTLNFEIYDGTAKQSSDLWDADRGAITKLEWVVE